MDVIKRMQAKQKKKQRSKKLWWLRTPPRFFLLISFVTFLLSSGSFFLRLFYVGIINITISSLIIGTQLLSQYGLIKQQGIFLTQTYDNVNEAIWNSIRERFTRVHFSYYFWMVVGFLLVLISILVGAV